MAESVYAVGALEVKKSSATSTFSNGITPNQLAPSFSLRISGGTAWACQIFANRQGALGPFPLYFYDQGTLTWYQAVVHSLNPHRLYQWRTLEDPRSPPAPCGVYAGIGTRELSPEGEEAIEYLFY